MATPNKSVSSHVPQTSQSVSARAGVSGTVHHLATSGPVRSTATPFANLQQGILAMSMQTAQKVTPVGHTTVKIGTPGVPLPTKAVASPGPSPRKKIKLEEVPPATGEIASTRKLILDERLSQMVEIKENYFDHLTECFFLQKGGQLMDYYHWRKKPTPELVHFLKSGHLDSDDEDENPLIYLRERKVTDEMKSQMIGPASTPVATSTTLPDSVVALSQQALVQGRTMGLTTSTVTTSAMSQQLSGQLHRSVSDSRLLGLASPSTKMSASSQSIKKSPGSPGRQAAFDGTNIKGISTQEAIVERAKQEAQVMSRVAELRKEGLWSSRRLPKVQEPTRVKAHWDYLLEEMQWLAADFLQERKWKKTCSRKIAKMVQKHFLDLEQKELRAEKEEGMKLRRIAGQIAKMVKEFWSNIEKVVQYKQNSRLDEKRKKAMDLHLNFIVDQTEKYSTWLSEGLAQSSKGSSVGSLNTTPDHSVAGDDEFKPDDSESDDEETIDKDEQGIDESETKDEVAALQKESEMPLDELIENLPKEILEKPATLHTESSDDETSKKEDKEFAAEDESEEDVEDSIAEQEKHEKPTDVKQELDELQDEGEMSIDQLRAKYAAAYDDNFEMPQDSGEESTDIDDSDDEESESEEELEEEEKEEEVEEEVDVEGDNDVGLEELVKSEEKTEKEDKAEPGKELTDIAAQAASLQPKGYTLQTAEVKTTVPFLLKHTLREYQHVGLDWLATMYEKRLNGILADEMGLGKTIQTIALLAHLACDKGIWGPHLIVVPTSVMLNWEMEFKKWAPGFKILTYYGSQKERKQKRTGWTKTNAFHVCITSYKLVIQDHQSFRRKKWKYLILDEAQNIKNFKSQRWQTLLNFNSMRRLLLTGTPLQNSLMELWSLMHFLMPHVFQSHKDFKEWFANPLTGMIEGSHEYNESLIRRLHKVLRPFLLRRLKDDVEKQMPKKYEHIVMCHLSKRQRFLYDEFMAQGKTKETLATGHFMSVINILMQLRKVCNHPSLFDPRPIVSPFQMEGIVYNTASMVHQVLQYNPLEDIDLHRYPGLAEMERDLPAFIAHRVRKLQTCKRLIEEIDIQPPPPPRPHRGKLKQSSIRCLSPAVQSGRASPAVHSRSVSPSPVIKPLSTTPVTSVPGTTQPPLQATVLPQISARGISSVTSSTPTSTNTSQPQPLPSSQPITVQIQHTDQGTRLVVPSGQLSQLPGFIQIVQTSTGQHLIATSTPTSSVVSTSTVVNGSPVVTMATSTVKTMVSSVVSQVKMSAGIQSSVTTSPSIHWPTVGPTQGQKPVMRVSPLTEPHKHVNGGGLVFTAATTSATTSVMSTSTKPVVTPLLVKHWQDEKCKLSKTEFFMESLYDKQQKKRREKLDFIARQNKLHCEVKPVYGQDLCEAIDIYKDPYSGKSYRNRDKLLWHGPGHIHCHCAKMCVNPHHPKHEWNQTKVLSDIIHSPEQYLSEMEDVLQRFVFATPPVQSPPLQMHVSHPPPTYRRDEVYRDYMLRTKLSPKADNYHKISTKMTVQFPELRLIQYDCGKLQTMDILLRRLKSGDHRVLIFTQMTRMLDILEAFLNYHGHRYLRLDGTTKVEQRQLLMDRFNADRRIFCFILSTRSGGIGVNLTGADTVIFYDSDWNPTMDAQAQDRCHRIGQTRDVHIYRLVSERTVEENILKKANQKRMLGDMAIEGGNFTTAFFKENTITELFSEPSGLESFVKEKEEEEKKKKEIKTVEKQERKTATKKQDPTEKEALAQFEKALAKTEDETDAVAIDQVKAEQKAELAEFDENIPWDEREAEQKEGESHVEMELAMLDKELSSIERFAVQFTEQQMEPVNNEELLNAEEDIELVKKDWELNRLKALKEEEERRAELEEDEMLYTYSRDDAYQQVFLSDMDHEQMPMWAPPTPPHDDNDVYIDETLFFLYEPTVMPETQLPPVYVKKEKKKIKVESITTRKQKQRKEEQPRVPRSLFDRPTAQLLKLRRDAKFQKMKLGQMKPYRPLPTLPPKPVMDQTVDHPEWLIHEDWALLQAVQSFFDVPLNLMIVNPAHTPNWDMVADVVNSCSRVYRSPKQCRLRYENVIIPREEGRIMYDMNPRKQKKQKGIYKMAKTNRAMKTGQIHSQDSNNGLTILYSLRFDSVKSIATKRPPTMRQTLVNPTLKNPKHASVLQENSITYDQPLNPMQVAEIRAQRIQREKKQNQQQQAAAAAATDQQTTVAVAPVVGGVQRATQQVAVPQVQVSTPTIVAMTTAVTPTQLATIGTAVSSATVLTVTGTPLGQATIRQRAPLTVQEISSGATVVGQMTGVSQVRAQLQTGTTTVTTALTPVQLAQRISATTTLSSGATVQQQLQAAAAGKTTALTQQQFQILQQQTLLQRQKQQHHMVQQQQLRTMQKLTLPADALRQQQQLRQLKGPVPVIQGQKTVIAQQLVTSMGQPVKQGQLKTPTGTLTRALTQEDMVRFKHQQQQLNQQLNQQKIATGQAAAGTSVTQIHHQQAGQLQITGTPLQQVSQALSKVSGQQAGATLVKTVTAPAGSVTIPSNVSINVSMPQKGVAKVSQLNPQQMHLLQRGKQTIPVQKGIGQKVNAPQMLNAVQIIQQQSGGRGLTIQQLHQLMKQQPQGATIQQIIHTSQPTIIATVTQSQATPQMVTKVMATSSTVQPSQMQTISASPVGGAVASGSTAASQSVTLAQVPMPSLNITSIAPGQSSMTASIVKPGSVSGVEAVTTVQIHPVTSITQSKLTGVTQNVVVQPMQSVQHVTVPAPVSQQTHMQVAGQQMTVSAPTGASQTLQMTVPTSPHVQAQVQHVTLSQTPPTHVTVTAQRGPTFSQASPITVTVTPTAPVQSPVHTPTQSTQQHTSVSHMGTPPTQSHIVSSLSQPITVSEQTVTTILQSQRTPTQPTVQVQHTPTPSQQPTTQTIHIQSPSVPQTGIQSALTGQPQSSSTSPQTTLQGKYSMRTRNQSKPQ